MMAMVLSQLQPVLEGFNRSLEQLSRQVGDLVREVGYLKRNQLEEELQPGPPNDMELDEAAEELLDTRLEVSQQIRDERADMENRLHHNFTTFKADVDMKLEQHQKMLQVSLQAMNETLSALKLDRDQDQAPDDDPEDQVSPPYLPPHQPQQLWDTSAIWEAIARLDNLVVNNTVKVSELMEDVNMTPGKIQPLERDLKELRELIDEKSKEIQVKYMMTGLDVEDAKVKVLNRVSELAGNLTLQDKRLQEMDVDVDYLYTALYKNSSSGDCNCNTLKASVAQLERAVANVTELAAENKLALDESGKGEVEQWGEANGHTQAVEALQHGLQQVKESLVSEQGRTRSLNHSLTQLSGSMTVGLAEISDLKDEDRRLREKTLHLSGSFNSLLKDAIRHNDVLELLLGEEVMEFLTWPEEDKKANSILALKQQLAEQNLKIASLLENRRGNREEEPSADQPSLSSSSSHGLLPEGMTRSGDGGPSRERQLILHSEPRRPEDRGDDSDLLNLENMVEKLGQKVHKLEGKPCPCPNVSTGREAAPAGVDVKLQAEVLWLKRGLEDHLSVFKNVFSNADVLARSHATLELDKLWELVKNKEKKRAGGGGGREGRGDKRRNRRDAAGVAPAPAGLAGDAVQFVAASPLSLSDGSITFEASRSWGHFHPSTGTFTAPVDGIYLFILSLDLRPGPVHVVLRRGSGGPAVSLHQAEVLMAGPVTSVGLLLLGEGEEVKLGLWRGAWTDTKDNVFTGLLLHRAT